MSVVYLAEPRSPGCCIIGEIITTGDLSDGPQDRAGVDALRAILERRGER
jgi:hypothetical protein